MLLENPIKQCSLTRLLTRYIQTKTSLSVFHNFSNFHSFKTFDVMESVIYNLI